MELNNEITEYRGDPPLPICYGQTILATTALSSSRHKTTSIIADSETEIIIVCLGSTTIETFISSVLQTLESTIATEYETEII